MWQRCGVGGVNADGWRRIIRVGKLHLAKLVTKIDRVVANLTGGFVRAGVVVAIVGHV
jgi:hypothetical protein